MKVIHVSIIIIIIAATTTIGLPCLLSLRLVIAEAQSHQEARPAF